MRVTRIGRAGLTRPFGDERTVTQAFPSGVKTEDADPFLMCDFFNMPSSGEALHEDDFPVDWHPHQGQTVVTYLKTGVGRHADSLGNRETFRTPGMQWMNCGSGVEHAEGGGNPKGTPSEGFQIWINMPAKHKGDNPTYGTETPESIPLLDVVNGVGNAKLRLLSGPLGDRVGPLKALVPIQMVDFELGESSTAPHSIPSDMDTSMLYIYKGSARLEESGPLKEGDIAVFDARDPSLRGFRLSTGPGESVGALLFSGKKLKEPITWHGPLVMTTKEEIASTFQKLRKGTFPPVRVQWDYKRVATRPKDFKPL
uniref:Pirin N-terminal domain-containing protein n=1 Tax=Chromera velia CCMP2878 TaxID=1169474 RepID=A0A0G4IFC9_9ALVE|eukprot:Cvel_13877.t1-p1 / transcript=Cvel_13877.t1 / gene=Cvel_13877 / organism=Chromera_velia_CCMP2878 / gene_product=Putative quercetin 2,3-dioxygenase PA3240, putative / transcript_product=Putative quercetin 2,3-dioxygenase PA3240, putative / location=Cvel_scaffold965:27121-28423(+) / protein_length=311 / sequence_SO=supercontig / SO=protein_coding / is_pseudo=false